MLQGRFRGGIMRHSLDSGQYLLLPARQVRQGDKSLWPLGPRQPGVERRLCGGGHIFNECWQHNAGFSQDLYFLQPALGERGIERHFLGLGGDR